MNVNRGLKTLLALIFLGSASLAQAQVSINFDEALAGYTPLPQFQQQVVDDQFLSLGILFRDANFPSLGAVVGDSTGGVGSDPVHLYSNNGSGGVDTLPNIDIFIVEPGNAGVPASVTSFSAMVTDSNNCTFSAYDTGNNFLGSVSSAGVLGEILTLEGIGPISRIEIRTASDATAIDDLEFEGLAPAFVPQPVPTLSAFSIGLLMILMLVVAGVITTRRQGLA